MSIARGTENNLVALPIFVTRGMVQRKFVMRRESSTPKDFGQQCSRSHEALVPVLPSPLVSDFGQLAPL